MMLRTGAHPVSPGRSARPGNLVLSVVPRAAAPLQMGTGVVCVRSLRRASKVLAVGKDGSGGGGSLPYGEALLQREYELWQRQSGMFEQLQEQHAADLARFASERASWQATEAALRAEAAELRAQLMYVMAQLSAAQAAAAAAAGGPLVGGAAPSASYSAASQQAALAGREPAGALPGFGATASSSSTASSPAAAGSGLSPGEQVKAVVDAVKAGSSLGLGQAGGAGSGLGAGTPTGNTATAAAAASSSSSGSSSAVSASEAWPAGGDAELPPYAADLAAAVAAVDTTDVLSGVSSYSMQARRAAEPAAEPTPASPPAPAQPAEEAASPSMQPPVPEQPAAAAAVPAEEAAAGAAAPAAQGQVEAAGAGLAARGPPPALMMGADDIFWVNQLHTALVDLGYFPGDEDIDDFFFGEGTQSALMTMQCCEDLPETGIADEATWARLLGPQLTLKPSRDLTSDMLLNVPGLSSLGGGSKAAASGSSSGSVTQGEEEEEQAGQAAAKPYAELFTAAFSETVGPAPGGGGVQDVQRLAVTDTVAVGDQVISESLQISTAVTETEAKTLTEWPVLHEGDGGREVHALHVALTRAGYYPSEDDERWWNFGDGTLAAVKTFQACQGYPESGVCDAATWRLLMGDDAHPSMILELRSGDSADEDLSAVSHDRVWLMGEQRWEDRSRVSKKKRS